MVLYFKPTCSVCQEAIGLLREANCTFEIREYLVDPPTQKELRELIRKLKCKAFDLVRTKEPLYKEQFAGKKITNTEWIRILSKNPVLLERPIIINETSAIIGRPAKRVLDLTAD